MLDLFNVILDDSLSCSFVVVLIEALAASHVTQIFFSEPFKIYDS